MKIDLSAMDRAYVSNRLRKRVVEIRTKLSQRDSGRAGEFTTEAEYAEDLAMRLDEGDAAQAKLPLTTASGESSV